MAFVTVLEFPQERTVAEAVGHGDEVEALVRICFDVPAENVPPGLGAAEEAAKAVMNNDKIGFAERAGRGEGNPMIAGWYGIACVLS